MSKKCKVEVQKGPINPDQKTYRSMTHSQRVIDRAQELKELKDGQTLKLHTPKR